MFALVAGLGVALWAYARAYSITPGTLGAIAADVRAGVSPIQAMDTHLVSLIGGAVLATVYHSRIALAEANAAAKYHQLAAAVSASPSPAAAPAQPSSPPVPGV